MARNVTLAIARVGRVAEEDLRALFMLLAGLTLSGAPLALWQIALRGLYRDIALHLPPALLLASLALALALSVGILHRLYRLTDQGAQAPLC